MYPDLAGIKHDFRKLATTQGRCFICHEISECEITRYQKSYHILYFSIKIKEEEIIFDWEKCGHRAILHEKKDVERYKNEQIETGTFAVPSYFDMNLMLTAKPHFNKPNMIIVMIVCVIFAALLAYIMVKLGIRYF